MDDIDTFKLKKGDIVHYNGAPVGVDHIKLDQYQRIWVVCDDGYEYCSVYLTQ
jgi:hypothetical protein